MAENVHRLRITIADIDPPIWRRLVVPSDATLADLHGYVQTVFGWWGSHLHEFEIGEERYGLDDGEGVEAPLDERRFRLGEVAGRGDQFLYRYDFGDDWEHVIDVEDVERADAGSPGPICLEGSRSAPPEDVGGAYGYARFLEAVADPNHEDHAELLEWVGGEFDPERFNVESVNAALESRVRATTSPRKRRRARR